MSQSGGGQPIPTPTSKASSAIPHHWWFDRTQTGIFNSSPPSQQSYPNSPPQASSPMSTSPPAYGEEFHFPDPKVAIPQPAPGDELKFRQDWAAGRRRSSLLSGLILDDFATPE